MSDSVARPDNPEDEWERPLTLVIPKLDVHWVLSPSEEEKVFEAIRSGRAASPKDFFEQLIERALHE